LKELEAEFAARITFKRLAPGVDLPEYLDQRFRNGEPRPEADIERGNPRKVASWCSIPAR